MTVHRITKWSAKRVGAGMTIAGTGASGEPIKMTNVQQIVHTDDGPVAILPGAVRVALA